MIKQILTIFILGLFFLPSNIFAQTDKEIAQKYGISFPITELGNCASIDECKTFCNNPDNYQKCTDFAKEHNLATHPSTSGSKKDEEILKLAAVELGCNTMDECMAFCEKEDNMDKCMEFASKHNLGGGNANQMKQVISSLKGVVGCTSMKSCMEACNQPQNQQKCAEVFQQAGFDTGGGNYSNEPPEVWCPKISSECKWDGNSCNCAGPDTCSKAPGCSWTGEYCSCGNGEYSNAPTDSGEIWCPQAGSDCKWDGTQCNCGNSSGEYTKESPEVWCAKAGTNCKWDGQQCSCFNAEGSPKTTTEGQNYQSSEDFAKECLAKSGCSFNSETKICTCATQTNNTSTDNPYTVQGGETIYKSECLAAGCKWSDNPNSCDCAGVGKDVQGVSTKPGLLQQLIDFLLGYLS